MRKTLQHMTGCSKFIHGHVFFPSPIAQCLLFPYSINLKRGHIVLAIVSTDYSSFPSATPLLGYPGHYFSWPS